MNTTTPSTTPSTTTWLKLLETALTNVGLSLHDVHGCTLPAAQMRRPLLHDSNGEDLPAYAFQARTSNCIFYGTSAGGRYCVHVLSRTPLMVPLKTPDREILDLIRLHMKSCVDNILHLLRQEEPTLTADRSWWIVSLSLARALRQRKAPVVELHDIHLWGRLPGPPLSKDPVLQNILLQGEVQTTTTTTP